MTGRIKERSQGQTALMNDPARTEMGLALARDVMWSPNETPISVFENYDRSLALYPVLEAHESSAKLRSEGRLDPFFLCSALVELGEGRHAAEFLRFAMESFPADFPKSQDDLACFQNALSLTVYTSTKAMERMKPAEWLESPVRQGLAEVLAQPLNAGPLKPGGGHEQLIKDAFHMPHIGTALLKIQDLDVFKVVYAGMSDSLRQVLVKDAADIMVPTRIGDVALQLELLSRVQAGKGAMGPVSLNKATLSFWKGSEALCEHLNKANDLAHWNAAVRHALDTFNIDSINKPLDELRQGKLWVMMIGMTNLLCQARDAGVELSADDYRASLNPMDKVASLAKEMQWRRPMGDSFDTLRVGIEKLFHGIPPQTIFKRALPTDLAAAMSELTDDVSWKAKASIVGQARIFTQELGV